MSLNDLSDFIDEDKEIEEKIENLDKYADISVEGFMEIINYKKKIINLVSTLNKLIPRKSRIDANRIFKWIKERSLSLSNEEEIISVERIKTKDDVKIIIKGTIFLFALVIGFLYWLISGIKEADIETKEAEREKRRIEEKNFKDKLDRNYSPKKLASLLNKKELDEQIYLAEKIYDDLDDKLQGKTSIEFDKNKIKKSAIEYTKKNYKKYIDKFEISDIVEKDKNYLIIHNDKNYARKYIKEDSLENHGYTRKDFDKYYEEYNEFKWVMNEWLIDRLVDIEDMLNNFEHMKVVLELTRSIKSIIINELDQVCHAIEEEGKVISRVHN